MTEQEIEDFFAALTPEDFDRSSAVRVEQVDQPQTGEAAFDAFVQELMARAATQYDEGDGRMDPLALLATTGSIHVFEGDHDEKVIDLYRRLRREASQLGALWFATAMIAPAAAAEVHLDNPHDQAEIDAKKATGELTYHLIWFAESVDLTHPIVRCGMWPIDEATGALQPCVEATPASAPALFLGVLHPEVQL
jgi:hypothetical protein